MIVVALILLFLTVVATGPAGKDWWSARRAATKALDDRVTARVVYLPSSRCRGPVDEDGGDC